MSKEFTTKSVFGKEIEFNSSVWFNKILKDHPEFGKKEEFIQEIKKTVEDPDYVVTGWAGEYLALRYCKIAPKRPKYLCVIYKEGEKKGFVITTFFISKHHKLLRRGIIWQKQK
jgi:hypothetical protein